MLSHALWWLVMCDFIAVVMMQYANNNKMLGPSDFVFKSMKACDAVEPVVKFGITQKKFNRTTNVLDITIESLDFEIGDNLVVELKGAHKKDGGFKPGAYYLKETVCKLLETIVGEIMDDIFEAAGIEQCPVPPGSYLASDYYFDNEKFTVPQLFGEYRMEINLFKEETLISCFIAYYDLLEKDKD